MHTPELMSPAAAQESVPLERLEAEITELAGHLAAAECRWLLLVAEYDRRRGYEEWGCRTCAHWLSWHCGLDLRAAQERVRVARALEPLPLDQRGVRRGQAELLEGARAHPGRDAGERVGARDGRAARDRGPGRTGSARLSRRAGQPRTRPSDANARHMARYLRYDWAEDGSLEGSFRIPPEMAAIFLKSVDVAREPDPAGSRRRTASRGNARVISRPRTVTPSMMMAETFLATMPPSERRRSLPDRRQRRRGRARPTTPTAGASSTTDRRSRPRPRGVSRATRPSSTRFNDAAGRPVAMTRQGAERSPHRPAAPCTRRDQRLPLPGLRRARVHPRPPRASPRRTAAATS